MISEENLALAVRRLAGHVRLAELQQLYCYHPEINANMPGSISGKTAMDLLREKNTPEAECCLAFLQQQQLLICAKNADLSGFDLLLQQGLADGWRETTDIDGNSLLHRLVLGDAPDMEKLACAKWLIAHGLSLEVENKRHERCYDLEQLPLNSELCRVLNPGNLVCPTLSELWQEAYAFFVGSGGELVAKPELRVPSLTQ